MCMWVAIWWRPDLPELNLGLIWVNMPEWLASICLPAPEPGVFSGSYVVIIRPTPAAT